MVRHVTSNIFTLGLAEETGGAVVYWNTKWIESGRVITLAVQTGDNKCLLHKVYCEQMWRLFSICTTDKHPSSGLLFLLSDVDRMEGEENDRILQEKIILTT